MLVSALTYRRLHPRLKISAKWGPMIGDPDINPITGEPSRPFGFYVHVKSKSPTETKVRRVLVMSKLRRTRSFGALFRVGSSASPEIYDFQHDALEKDLTPFGGLWWEIKGPDLILPNIQSYAIEVRLANGYRKRSRWMSGRRLQRKVASFNKGVEDAVLLMEENRRLVEQRMSHIEAERGSGEEE